MKLCKYCQKELTATQRNGIFCSQECFKAFARQEKINKWLNGEDDGLRGVNQLSLIIRNYLLEKAEYKCEKCGWHEVNPTTGLVPLEVHHIDGDYKNNAPENLQVLCPSCHSLTPNFKSLNREGREGRTGISRKKYKTNICIDCGTLICYNSIRCNSCEAKNRQPEKPMTREELKEMIRTMSFTEIGRKYKCTDNNIRKYCDFYNLPRTKKEINSYSDEEWKNI